jgi:hypothetical protein
MERGSIIAVDYDCFGYFFPVIFAVKQIVSNSENF